MVTCVRIAEPDPLPLQAPKSLGLILVAGLGLLLVSRMRFLKARRDPDILETRGSLDVLLSDVQNVSRNTGCMSQWEQ